MNTIYKGTLYDNVKLNFVNDTDVVEIAELRIFNPSTKEHATFRKSDDGTFYLLPDDTIGMTSGSYSLEVYDSDGRMIGSKPNEFRLSESSKVFN